MTLLIISALGILCVYFFIWTLLAINQEQDDSDD